MRSRDAKCSSALIAERRGREEEERHEEDDEENEEDDEEDEEDWEVDDTSGQTFMAELSIGTLG